MKFWLIIFFVSPNGDYMGKREIAYKDEVRCYQAMEYIRPPRRSWTTQMVCVSDDHYRGRKQDKNIPYD